DQAVINAAAGCRFDETGGIAERQHAVAVGSLDGSKRQDLLPRLPHIRWTDSPSRRQPRHDVAKMPAGAALAHDADADVRTLALHGNRPRETLRRHAPPEVHLHITETCGG